MALLLIGPTLSPISLPPRHAEENKEIIMSNEGLL